MDVDLLCAATTIACYMLKKKLLNRLKQKKRRRRFERKLLKNRQIEKKNVYVAPLTSSEELSDVNAPSDVEEHNTLVGLSRNLFDDLLNKISVKIQKSDTQFREALTAKIKLQTTLRYLASGDSYRSLCQLFRVSCSSISKFIPEVCDAIYEALTDYTKVPHTEEDWKKIQKGFELKWNFPGCIGAIDGKHIELRGSANSGSDFNNDKKSFSIVLLACADDDYTFSYFEIGAKTRYSDEEIYNDCSLKRAIENGTLNIPDQSVFVADAAFPLKTNVLKPYPGDYLTIPQQIFNYRLSRAQRTIENTFGILTSRFKIFESRIANNVDNTIKITRACCALHNWLRKTSKDYLTSELVDNENTETGIIIHGSWRQKPVQGFRNLEVSNTNTNTFDENAISVRDRYSEYFINEGADPWQMNSMY